MTGLIIPKRGLNYKSVFCVVDNVGRALVTRKSIFTDSKLLLLPIKYQSINVFNLENIALHKISAVMFDFKCNTILSGDKKKTFKLLYLHKYPEESKRIRY